MNVLAKFFMCSMFHMHKFIIITLMQGIKDEESFKVLNQAVQALTKVSPTMKHHY